MKGQTALTFDIPGAKTLEIEHVLLDYNGTIAEDGLLIPGVAERLRDLAQLASVSVLTADTCGTVKKQCEGLPVQVRVFDNDHASSCKAEVARACKPCACVGNGANDIEMFDEAALSIAVVGTEGAAGALLSHASVVVTSPLDALDLLLKANRLRATLRH